MNEAVGIRFESVPLDEEIKRSQGKGEPGLERSPGPMSDFFQMTDPTQHRQHGFDQHPGIPEATITQFEISRIAFFGMKGRITQHDHLFFKEFDHRMEGGIGGIGTSTVPGHDQAEMIEQHAKFAPDNPAMIRFSFAPNLPTAAPFAHGMQQFNAIAIDYAQDRRRHQELIGPAPVYSQQAKQPRPFRQRRKQFAPIPAQPPIKRPIPDSFERKEQPDRHDFTGPQVLPRDV